MTRAAVTFLDEILADPQGPIIRCRLLPGHGIIGNNVLHDRAALQNDSCRQRLAYRARLFDRIAGTGPQDAM